MLKLFWKLTGGRPMTYKGFAFTDIVTGNSVNYYVDKLGRRWLAEGRFSRVRVESKGMSSVDEFVENLTNPHN